MKVSDLIKSLKKVGIEKIKALPPSGLMFRPVKEGVAYVVKCNPFDIKVVHALFVFRSLVVFSVKKERIVEAFPLRPFSLKILKIRPDYLVEVSRTAKVLKLLDFL